MKADYSIGGGWGDHIDWFYLDAFKTWDGNEDQLFRVHGHKQDIPKVGQTLMGEFENSFIKFKFMEVERMSDPPDQFFAKVRPIEQELKETPCKQ